MMEQFDDCPLCEEAGSPPKQATYRVEEGVYICGRHYGLIKGYYAETVVPDQ